jgi:hypothetical protein
VKRFAIASGIVMPIHRVALIACFAFMGVAWSQAPKPQAPPAEKTYTISFDKTPWNDVFKWFEKESGLTYIDTDKIDGTFTHKADRKYTLPQVIDLMNEALAQKKLIIIRRSQTFLVQPSDKRLPPELVQMITNDELSIRGDTEVVQVILSIRSEITDDVDKEIKKRLGKHGVATAFGADQIIIHDAAKNVRDIQAYMRSIHELIQPGSALLKYRCKYIRPSKAMGQLQQMLVDPKSMKPKTEGSEPRGWGGKVVPEKAGRLGTVYYSIDDGEIRFKGPIKDVAKWVGILQVIDKVEAADPGSGKEIWKTYPVTPGTAEALAKAMQAMPEFKNSGIQFLAVGTSEVRVYASPADHKDIQNYLALPPEKK